MHGIDPDGLPGGDAQELAAMLEATRKVPARNLWIEDYRLAEESAKWDGLAQL